MSNRYGELNSYLQKQFDGLINSVASHQVGGIDVVWNLEHVHNLEDECTWLVEGYQREERGLAQFWWCDSREQADDLVRCYNLSLASVDQIDAWRITRIAVLDHEWIEEIEESEVQ
jgi:hypothetical protein